MSPEEIEQLKETNLSMQLYLVELLNRLNYFTTCTRFRTPEDAADFRRVIEILYKLLSPNLRWVPDAQPGGAQQEQGPSMINALDDSPGLGDKSKAHITLMRKTQMRGVVFLSDGSDEAAIAINAESQMMAAVILKAALEAIKDAISRLPAVPDGPVLESSRTRTGDWLDRSEHSL